jgi:hypothetical protein
MLTILGAPQRFCDGVSRRSFLQIGGLALGGLSLPQILEAEGRATGTGTRPAREKGAIMIYLPGGPPHQDLFDLKPEAPRKAAGPNSAPSSRSCAVRSIPRCRPSSGSRR